MFVNECYRYLNKFPRKERFTFTDKIKNLMLDEMELIVQMDLSSSWEEKLKLAKNLSCKYDLHKSIISLALKLGIIRTKYHHRFSLYLTELGKITGGYIKSAKKKLKEPKFR